MTDSTRDAIFEEIALETAHFSAAPAAFFHAWKRGVELAGTHLFGNGTHAELDHAASVWDLRPKVQLIEHAIGVMSSGQKVFIAALVSFYNAEDGGRLFEHRCPWPCRSRRAGPETTGRHRRIDHELQRLVAARTLSVITFIHPRGDMRPCRGPCPFLYRGMPSTKPAR